MLPVCDQRIAGKGKFGLVRIAQHKKSKKPYALKRITKEVRLLR